MNRCKNIPTKDSYCVDTCLFFVISSIVFLSRLRVFQHFICTYKLLKQFFSFNFVGRFFMLVWVISDNSLVKVLFDVMLCHKVCGIQTQNLVES